MNTRQLMKNGNNPHLGWGRTRAVTKHYVMQHQKWCGITITRGNKSYVIPQTGIKKDGHLKKSIQKYINDCNIEKLQERGVKVKCI